MSLYKPYPAYENSSADWLPRRPPHWKDLRLGALFQERRERGGEKSELLAVSQQYGVLPQEQFMEITERRLSASTSDDWSNYRRVCIGDLVYNKMRLWQGAIGLSSYDGIVSPAYVVLHPLAEISGQFYEYLFKTPLFVAEAGRYSQGLCDDMNSCRYEDFKSASIIVPPLEEQRTITTYLDRETARIDALVAAKSRFIDLLCEKRQALITHAVTKGLDPNVKMKDSGAEWLGQVPEHWEVSRLKFIALIQTGVAKGKDNAGKSTVEVPYLRVANVQDGYLDLNEVATIEIPQEDLPRYLLRPGDVLMNEGGDYDKLGRGHVWRGEIEPCIHQNHVFAVRPTNVLPDWLNAFTSSTAAQFYFMGRSKQSTNLASISSTNLMELPVPLPPEKEQKEILHGLDRKTARIDALIAKTERSIELLKERRSALITAAVTGQIDLREATP